MNVKGFGFGLKTMTHHISLVPIVAITGGACVMCASYVTYMCATKSDMNFNKFRTMPYSHIKPDEYKKFMRLSYEYKSQPEIEALRRELGSSA